MFPARQVFPRIWIGSYETAQDQRFMRENRIGLIINCTQHVPSPFKDDIPTYRVPVDDSPEWGDLLKSHVYHTSKLIHHILTKTSKSVLVHCHAGVSRSSTVVASYLILEKGYTSEQAIRQIQTHKPETFRPTPVFRRVLETL